MELTAHHPVCAYQFLYSPSQIEHQRNHRRPYGSQSVRTWTYQWHNVSTLNLRLPSVNVATSSSKDEQTNKTLYFSECVILKVGADYSETGLEVCPHMIVYSHLSILSCLPTPAAASHLVTGFSQECVARFCLGRSYCVVVLTESLCRPYNSTLCHC